MIGGAERTGVNIVWILDEIFEGWSIHDGRMPECMAIRSIILLEM
jgi:hypothetical protein